MSYVVAIWGEEKSTKTTLALTFPKPIYHFDLDVGGYERAAWRLDVKEVTTKSYPTPLQIEKLMGATHDGVSIKIPKKVVGMRELWQKIMSDYVEVVQKTDVATIIMDSATQLWSICHTAYLQELQEKQILQGTPDKDLRERLIPIEYGTPNDRMKSVIFTARSFNKNLILTHYPKDIYASKLTDKGVVEYKTGEVDVDGFKQTKALADLVILTIAKNTNDGLQIVAEITLSGLSKLLEGYKILDPTYLKIKAAVDKARVVTT